MSTDPKPRGWMRRWAYDRESEYKVLNPDTGKMRLHRKFTFHAVTMSKVLPDDVPLFAAHDLVASNRKEGDDG